MNKFEELLELFEEVLKESPNYHVEYLSGLGYVEIYGRYYPEAETSNDALREISVDAYYRSPEELAEGLMENLRWHWYEKNGKPVCTDDYENIRDMDQRLSKAYFKEYFQMIDSYERKIKGILNK